MRKSARQTTAYHEAGHVVGAHFQGLKVRETSIAETDTVAGFTINDDPDFKAKGKSRRRMETERAIITLYAGEIAQRRFAASSVRHWQASNDRAAIRDLLRTLDASQDAAEAHGKALERATHDLIGQHWPEVTAVAEALLEDETLRTDRIARLIAGARQRARHKAR